MWDDTALPFGICEKRCVIYNLFTLQTMLVWRCRSGIITKEMLQAPDRKLFLWIGGLEATSQLLGFIGASKLPGVVLPLLQQSLLIWQVTLAYLVLNKRLDSVQVSPSLLHNLHLLVEEPWRMIPIPRPSNAGGPPSRIAATTLELS